MHWISPIRPRMADNLSVLVVDSGIRDIGFHYPAATSTPESSPTPGSSPPTSTPVPTLTPTVTRTPVHTLTPSPSPTPNPSVTPSPTPTATQVPSPCPPTGIWCLVPPGSWRPGDTVYLDVLVGNQEFNRSLHLPVFALLDIGMGEYWFAPSWVCYPPEIDYYREIVVPPCECHEFHALNPFTWPTGAGVTGKPCCFTVALMNTLITELLYLDSCEFSYTDE